MRCPTCRKAVLDTVRLIGNHVVAAAGDQSETKEQSATQLQADILRSVEVLAATLLAHEHHPAATEVQVIASTIRSGGDVKPAIEELQTIASAT
ncbi:MAG: hypothetical protein Q7S08_01050 [bacterium]|nr:hypothetical protein [bacterium]